MAINGYDTLEMPVAESSGDVPIAWFVLSAISGSDNLLLAMHNGELADVIGISDAKTPIEVVVSMKEKGGFKFGLEMRNVQYLDVYVENYPTLSIEEFANFRVVHTTGMGKNKLYRSSSPIDPCLGRNLKADSLAKEAGIATFINLADAEEYAIAFNGFDSSYYASQNALFLALPVEFFSKPFEEGLAKGFRYMIEHEGPYLIHCTYGMDRTDRRNPSRLRKDIQQLLLRHRWQANYFERATGGLFQSRCSKKSKGRLSRRGCQHPRHRQY